MSIAIFGYGVVGSGVAGVIARCADEVEKRSGVRLEVRTIVDVRDFPEDDPYAHLIVSDADTVFSDPSIDIVVETIGGTGVAYDFTKRAMLAGKNVVTSNKELVATHGPELLRLAADNRVRYRYEASVGGGIPIIRPLHNDLAANRILSIAGIVNGTTNYILTRMEQDGVGFQEALSEAQENGYAEQDPTADVDGLDAGRKLAIMASIVLHEHVPPENIHTVGIRDVSPEDSRLAAALGGNLKLIASMRRYDDDRVALIVAPHFVANDQPLAGTHGVFNAVQVTGDSVGDTMFYGQGAGTWPTASAVVADVIELATLPYTTVDAETWPEASPGRLISHKDAPVRAIVRFKSGADRRAEIVSELAELRPEIVELAGDDLVLRVGDQNEVAGAPTDDVVTEGRLVEALREWTPETVSILRVL
ncbi:MAG: homoserine dehydrogenase [Fastidiosipilaceae bacterium]|jgi:homoserine dehydrogenase